MAKNRASGRFARDNQKSGFFFRTPVAGTSSTIVAPFVHAPSHVSASSNSHGQSRSRVSSHGVSTPNHIHPPKSCFSWLEPGHFSSPKQTHYGDRTAPVVTAENFDPLCVRADRVDQF